MIPGKLGSMLVESRAITEDQLQAAIQRQGETGQLFGQLLVELGYVTLEDIARVLAKQLEIPYLDLGEEFKIGPDEVRLIPEAVARRFLVIPTPRIDDSTITVAMSDPVDIEAIDAVRSITNLEVHKAVATEDRIVAAIDKFYREDAHIESTLKDIVDVELDEPAEIRDASSINDNELRVIANDAPVVRFVNLLLMQAVRDRASDVHFEPGEEAVSVRLRVDGVLREVTPPPKSLYRGVVTRIKILSDMDIAERRLPLDGRFKFRVQDRVIDVRVSSLPEIHGEKMVLRILDRESLLLDLRDIGFDEDMLERFQTMLKSPNGIILLTGPTGSGKTTTLYSALNFMKGPEKNIQTIEDPVEYQMAGINQMQVRSQIGLDFASSLRAILRQDPDIILIGEIRDIETAQIAMRASLTGHLVMSTLHTNDAPAAFPRLTDIGIEPYLIAATVKAVLAQRLVRLICEDCKEEVTPAAGILSTLEPFAPDVSNWTHYKGSGCEKCLHIGYLGRRACFGFLEVTDPIRELIIAETGEVEFRKQVHALGVETLMINGLKKVKAGVTTLEEVISVSPIDSAG